MRWCSQLITICNNAPEPATSIHQLIHLNHTKCRLARERAAGRAAPRAPRRPTFTAAYLEEDDYGAGGDLFGEEEEEADRGRDDELYRRRMADEEEEVRGVLCCCVGLYGS